VTDQPGSLQVGEELLGAAQAATRKVDRVNLGGGKDAMLSERGDDLDRRLDLLPRAPRSRRLRYSPQRWRGIDSSPPRWLRSAPAGLAASLEARVSETTSVVTLERTTRAP
jgi:hypothetical protein